MNLQVDYESQFNYQLIMLLTGEEKPESSNEMFMKMFLGNN